MLNKDIFQGLGWIRELKTKKEKHKALEKYSKDANFKAFIDICFLKVKKGVSQKSLSSIVVPFRSQTTRIDFQSLKNLIIENQQSNSMKSVKDAIVEIYSNTDSYGRQLLEYIAKNNCNTGISTLELDPTLELGLKFKVRYQRSGIFKPKNKIQYPAFIQKKMDGTYREFRNVQGKIICLSRNGHQQNFPKSFNEIFKKILKENEHIIGELTILGKPRNESNGILNSKTNNFKNVVFTVWDILTDEEYSGLAKTPYKARFERLEALSEKLKKYKAQIVVVETTIVQNEKEAIDIFQNYIQANEEGAILKDFSAPFKDGVSNLSLKLKNIFDIDVRITGFNNSLNRKIQSINFETDDKKVTGAASGFTRKQEQEFYKNIERFIGQIMTIQGNGIIGDVNNRTKIGILYPVFKEIRTDKGETDDLERILQMQAFKV